MTSLELKMLKEKVFTPENSLHLEEWTADNSKWEQYIKAEALKIKPTVKASELTQAYEICIGHSMRLLSQRPAYEKLADLDKKIKMLDAKANKTEEEKKRLIMLMLERNEKKPY